MIAILRDWVIFAIFLVSFSPVIKVTYLLSDTQAASKLICMQCCINLHILKSSFPFQVTLADHLQIQILLIVTANFNTFGKISRHNN